VIGCWWCDAQLARVVGYVDQADLGLHR
jgi:hypothetical protein